MITVKQVGDDSIRLAIKENDGYCLCAVEKNKDTKCICKAFLEQEESGLCHCGLYEKYEVKEEA